MALSYKLRLVRFSVGLKFQDRAECGNIDGRTILLPYEQTESNFSTSSYSWNTAFTLQTAVGNNRGEKSDIIDLFGDINLDPPRDISVTHEVIDDELTAVVQWSNGNVFKDRTGPPAVVKFWVETEEGEIKLIDEKTIPNNQNGLRISFGEDIPWNTRFSIHSDFGVNQGLESGYFALFNPDHLT